MVNTQPLPAEFRFRQSSAQSAAKPFAGDTVLSSAKDTDPCACAMGEDNAILSSPKDTDPCACAMGEDNALVSGESWNLAKVG